MAVTLCYVIMQSIVCLVRSASGCQALRQVYRRMPAVTASALLPFELRPACHPSIRSSSHDILTAALDTGADSSNLLFEHIGARPWVVSAIVLCVRSDHRHD